LAKERSVDVDVVVAEEAAVVVSLEGTPKEPTRPTWDRRMVATTVE
jgi:hypothetical protein